jgi:PAS domain S-box-containing protein
MKATVPLSIRHRLALGVFAAAGFALMWVGVAVAFDEATNFRPRAVQRLQSQGTVLSAILQPALDFNDPEGALRYLTAYRTAQRELAVIAVYDRSGRLFASVVREGSPLTIPAAPDTASPGVSSNQIVLRQPIERDRQVLGSLYIVEDLPTLSGQYNIIVGAVLLAVIVMGAALLGGVQQYFLAPLASLVETVGRIASDKNYSIRAPVLRQDELGRLAQSFNQMLEVIDRRDASLRESEERMRRLAWATFEGIVFSEGGSVLETNEQAAQMFGYEISELPGKPVLDFIAPESRDVVQGIMRKLDATSSYTVVALRRDGSTFPVEAQTRELFYQGRKARVSALRDITGRKQAEEAMRRSEEKFSKAFMASPTPLTISHVATGTIVDVNSAFERLSGFTRAEVIGRTGVELGMWARPENRERIIQEFKRQGALRDIDFDFRAKHGAVIYCRVSAESITLDGEPSILTALVDLTERKRAETEHARLETQLQQAQKLEAVGRLAGGVAHDFNNMLTVILGHVEMALLRIDPADRVHASLVQIEHAAQHSANLTRKLLAFARRQTVVPRVLDLNATVSGMLGMLQRLIGEDIHLDWRPGDELWRVRIDPAQVDQILANLTVNARDAISGVGTITIETANAEFSDGYCANHPDHVPGSFAMLAVGDNGRGIDTETLEHIFEPFFTTKDLGEGTGLGLATVFGIVQQNDGFLTVSSEPGSGATFKIYLPRYVGDAIDEAEHVDATEAPKGRGETVLLVEDERAILALGRDLLEQLGYTVLTADSPREALRIAESRAGDIALLVTDVVMPEMNGRELAERIALMKPGLRCLYVSGYTASIIASRGVLDEGMRFLQKPFSMKDLALKIRDALDAR